MRGPRLMSISGEPPRQPRFLKSFRASSSSCETSVEPLFKQGPVLCSALLNRSTGSRSYSHEGHMSTILISVRSSKTLR
ncbi:hypothetical protein Mapa_014172 [Marchantia paleacea]|nr:hypothetical protein Mapa_014172 [Marchantia paleacea]